MGLGKVRSVNLEVTGATRTVTGAPQRAAQGNMRVTWIAFGLWAGLAASAVLFQGCAGTKSAESKSGKSGPSAVKVDEAADLSELSKAVKTQDDAAVLNLLLGYRMLLLKNPDANSLDKETLKKSRQAYDRLEAALRHGGLQSQSQDGGERVYTVTNEEKLSLQEVIRSASAAAEKDARDGDWEKAKARWKEIVQSKTAVTFTMEEAQWGLTLADALQSALPDSIKKRLKEVNESYAADMNHEEIGKQVKVLLEAIPDVKLQRELKKLANRAWEKDKRAGRLTSPQVVQTLPPENLPPVADSVKALPGVTPPAAAAGSGMPTQAAAPMSPEAAAVAAEADTLTSQGKYVAALKSLDKAGDQPWVKEKKNRIGDRFCEDKRRSAANSFKDFKKASDDSMKRILLKRTASDLDSCLFYFPELSVSQKVRKNREMVETELKKLKP